MITSNNNSLCREAELFYYDILNNDNIGPIPKTITDHINQCQYCREKINQLEIGLSSCKSNKPQSNQIKIAITDLLNLHLAYTGDKVACNTVKPFLPVITDPDLGIRIPTPITVHLDHCPECAQYLKTIRSLNLSRTQLCRLGQLLADKTTKGAVSCSQARAAIQAVVSMDFHKTNEKVLKHLCKCENCRQALYEYRETIRTEYKEELSQLKCSICEQLSTGDIFDYVITYGLDPTDEQSNTFRDSLTSHLRDCPRALAKIQELHRTIYEIAERAESQVVTIYHIDEFSETQEASKSNDLYAGFPISVEIETPEDKYNSTQTASTIKYSTTLRRKISALNVNPLLKTGIIAVAVLLMAVTFFFKSSVAGAVTMEQIYTAIENAKNVYISTFMDGKPEPTQERWFSSTFNVFLTKTGEDLVFLNLANKTRTIKNMDINSVQIEPLTDNFITDVKQSISGSLALMPFDNISELPDDVEWNRLRNDESEASINNTEVYELTWIDKTNTGTPVFSKWRFTIDLETNRPRNIQCYRKLDADGQYTLNTTKTVEYLDDSAMQTVFEKYSLE